MTEDPFATEIALYDIAAWLDDERLDDMAATFDAATGSTRDRLAAAVAAHAGAKLSPLEPLELPDRWESLPKSELAELARAAARFGVPASADRDALISTINVECARRERVAEAVALRDRYRAGTQQATTGT